MFCLNTIGIIGQGFVGSAIKNGFEKKSNVQVFTYDIKKECNSISTESVVEASDIVFICLPTPMSTDGSCDTSIVDDTLFTIAKKAKKLGKTKVAVIKSTCSPGSTENWNKKYNEYGLEVVFNPEFLVAKTAKQDFENATRIVLGGKATYTTLLKALYKKAFDCKVIEVDSTTAETIKYVTNTFLTLKVSYCNEVHMLCNKLDINYQELMDIVCIDQRITSSHTSVPGPDGQYGYGGYCFPKDIAAFINTFNDNDLTSLTLKAAKAANTKIRKND